MTELATLQEELGYLKALWDMVGAVMFTFTDWYATLWDKIDVDFLVEETKKLTKDIKQLNKAVRNYEVYRYSHLLCSRCLFFTCAITVTMCACTILLCLCLRHVPGPSQTHLTVLSMLLHVGLTHKLPVTPCLRSIQLQDKEHVFLHLQAA